MPDRIHLICDFFYFNFFLFMNYELCLPSNLNILHVVFIGEIFYA